MFTVDVALGAIGKSTVAEGQIPRFAGVSDIRAYSEYSEEVPLSRPRKMLMSVMSESEAIEGAKRGDGDCFEFLYKRHKRHVYSICLRMMGNVELAEDLAQEAFLQLYRKIASFRGDSAFSTWLHRITVNIALMRLRKRGLPEVSLDEILEPNEEGGAPKEFGQQDHILAGSIDRVVLERAIENLSPGYRVVFLLHDIEGYEHNEIAEMLGCTVGTCKSQLHKARTNLRDVLNVTRAEGIRRSVTLKRKTSWEVTVLPGRRENAASAA